MAADASSGLSTTSVDRVGLDGPARRRRRPARHAQGRPRRLSAVAARPGRRRPAGRSHAQPDDRRHAERADRHADAATDRRRPRPSTALLTIAQALETTDRDVRIQGVVTAGADLLDASGRRIVVQDATRRGRDPAPGRTSTAPALGARVEVAGRMGAAYGAPRLRADDLERLGPATVPAPARRPRGAHRRPHLAAGDRSSGRVEDTRKLGDRVARRDRRRAQRIVVVAQPGAGLTTADLPEGATVDVTGIVRRAYPNATRPPPERSCRAPPATSDESARHQRQRVDGRRATGAGAGRRPARRDGATRRAGASAARGSRVPDADLVDLAARRRADRPGRRPRQRPHARRLHARRRHGHRRGRS